MRRFLFLIIVFYLLALIQSSFLIHFSLFGVIPNFILILVCLLSFFSFSGGNRDEKISLYSAFLGGFLLDIFSSSFLGLSIIVLLIISILIKKSLRVLREQTELYSIIYFILLFITSLIFYDLFLSIAFYWLYSAPLQFNLWIILTKMIYNLIFALPAFFIFKKYRLYAQ